MTENGHFRVKIAYKTHFLLFLLCRVMLFDTKIPKTVSGFWDFGVPQMAKSPHFRGAGVKSVKNVEK